MSTLNRTRLVLCTLVALPLAIVLAFWMRPKLPPELAISGGSDRSAFDPAELKTFLDARRELDRTLWAPEQLALAHENTFIRLWDDLRRRNAAQALADFPFETITLGERVREQIEENGITSYSLTRNPRVVSARNFRQMVSVWRAAGYRLIQSEWHHETFKPSEDGRHLSTLQLSLHVFADGSEERIDITGPIEVRWSGRASDGFPIPEAIDARGLILSTRGGADAFVEQFDEALEAIQTEAAYNDILACDLDGDGLSELAYPRTNRLLRNRGSGEFQQATLCDHPLQGICEGLFVDYTGNGRTDLLCAAVNAAGSSRAIYLFEADKAGRYSSAPQLLTNPQLELPSPDSITVGDIDLDGDLDIFVTQYHAPYRDGKMPSPRDDANDGLPCYLFINDGAGRLRDATEARGISEKRWRRAYRSSFVDLDDDGDLDLLVTSDFSGVDAYENDGRGFFRDVTERWFDERVLFGMSHVVADFNNDSELDLYAAGMASTTARRLETLGLFRAEVPDDRHRRARLAYGNRLYFRQPGPRYLELPASVHVARAGWSWGCAAFDVENDGDVDLYVANGHLSGKSAADYCTRFWCHDIYVGHNQPPGFVDLVKRNSLQIGTEVSWNGYEKNRLFLNREGAGFFSGGFLMDVAMEEDSRSVLSDDMDGDGRVDLLVGFADRRYQPPQYVLRGFLNRWNSENHWIGVRLKNVTGAMLVGAKVVVHTSSGSKVDTVIVGESFASQQAPVVHFGLGGVTNVDAVEVQWVGGKTTRLTMPAIDQYHTVEPAIGQTEP